MEESEHLSRVGDATLRERLRYHVQQAGDLCGDLFVNERLGASGSRFGGLGVRVRRPLHDLVRFYLDVFAVRQGSFNFFLSRALATLSRELDELLDTWPRADFEDLRQRVTSLSERAAQLERKVEALQRAGQEKT